MDPREPLQAIERQALAALVAAGVSVSADAEPRVGRLALASDFAIDTLARQPGLLARLLADSQTPLEMPELAPGIPDEWPGVLRRHRAAESTRLIWRDVVEGADVTEILHGATALAEGCLQAALTALETQFTARHGVVRNGEGTAQRLLVFGLGKLGGGELNFSSDIDIVYAYPEEGESDGARALPAEMYFMRLGQALAKLLDEVTADGFCHRVDLRLRPYGNAGRVAWSFPALELYFQREGRDWERYAWQKARPVAGDVAEGERFLQAIRPFVYRRYLDFGALDGLREMKALINAEVARQDRADDIKRGPGGIREIEFLAQALQLIRGGRVPALQQRSLPAALRALVASGDFDAAEAERLQQDYYALRRLENRLQMLRDAQVHRLPPEPLDRARLAATLDYSDWDGLASDLAGRRARVSAAFGALLAPRRDGAAVGDAEGYWRALPEGGDEGVLATLGFNDAAAADDALREFARSGGVRTASAITRGRLDRVMPALIDATARAADPDVALPRTLALVRNVLRRSSYLALLDEQPDALHRLVDLLSRSALMGERLAAYPVLLDELLDSRLPDALPDRDAMHAACAAAVSAQHDDTERALADLNEVRQAVSFRIALSVLDGRLPATEASRRLAWLADAVLAQVVRMARADVSRAHGDVPGARFAVLGYGSLGGEDLAFGSDLDLVFLFDAPDAAESDGPRMLDAVRWHARVAQKIVTLLQSPTGAGRLFDVDVRLRPDGAKGLLVSTLASYAEYQRQRAWTWEHQALVRARGVAGDPGLLGDFEALRGDILERPRDIGGLRAEVDAMRARMRGELDRSTAARIDLKQGEGGLVDFEFLLQFLVLAHAPATRALSMPRRTIELLDACVATGVLDAATGEALRAAHALLSERAMRCMLDRRRRVVDRDQDIDAATAVISAAVRGSGLVFARAPGEP